MPKDRKVKEVIKTEYKEKVVDNSKSKDIYLTAVNKAATGYAERVARENSVKVLHCPGIDFGVRVLAKALVDDNIIDAEKLFEYLKRKSYRNYDNIILEWWKDDNK